MKNMQITAGGFAAYKYNKVIFNNVIQVIFNNVIHYTSFSGFYTSLKTMENLLLI